MSAADFHMLSLEELEAAMPLCAEVSMAGARSLDFTTAITPEEGEVLAAALAASVVGEVSA